MVTAMVAQAQTSLRRADAQVSVSDCLQARGPGPAALFPGSFRPKIGAEHGRGPRPGSYFPNASLL